MDELASQLRNLGSRLQRLPDPASRSADARQVAEQLEYLCRTLYRQVYESGNGGHPAYTYDNPSTSREVTEPELSSPALLVPFLNNRSAQLADEMLQRSALYSEISVVVMPFRVKNMEISYSAVGADRRDYDAYQELFRYNRRYASLVAGGRCVFLPRRYTFDAESTWGWSRSDYTAPLLQDPTSLTYLPVNLRLGRSPYQDLRVYETFMLPYFPETSLDDVAAIAQKETDSFILFNMYLTKQLGRLSNPESAEEWSEVIEEIRAEVARLHIEAKKVARSKVLRDAQIVMFAVSLGTVLAAHNVKVDDIAGILGSVNLLQLLQGELQRRDDSDKLRQSEFFVPYLLSAHGQSANRRQRL